MSEMIDGYTAQKIKDFWMAQPSRRSAVKTFEALFDHIADLENRLNLASIALKSIALNSCCCDCKEAGLWAEKTLKELGLLEKGK